MADDYYSRVTEAATDADSRRLLHWIPAIIFAYVFLLSPLIVQAMAPSESTNVNVAGAQSNPANQLFWIGMLALTLIAVRRDFGAAFRLLRDPVVVLVVAYLAFAAMSLLWSYAPAISFRRLVLQVIVVLSVILPSALATDRDRMLERILAVIVMAVVLNFVVVLATPPGPLGHEGIYDHKNTLGSMMMFAICLCLYGAATRRGTLRIVFLACVVMAFVALVESRSKTSLGLAVMMPALTFMAIAIARPVRMNVAAFVLFAAVFAIAAWFYISALTGYTFADMSMLLFGDTTFTGRTIIWEFVLDVISRSPLVGQGYAAFWGVGAGSIVDTEAPALVARLQQAHNGFLDVFVETGLIGLIILLALIVATLLSAAKSLERQPALCWLAITLVLIVVSHNMLESSLFRSYSLAWLLFLFAAFLPRAGDFERAANAKPRG
ncbi:O-antigen ligase family protein [Oricola indica]|uniref:O-antigen ligase family protein n=1 Tax=Oricola indica TaxID=2872591 RepID=UPI003CCC0DCC